jgi:chorismate mutase
MKAPPRPTTVPTTMPTRGRISPSTAREHRGRPPTSAHPPEPTVPADGTARSASGATTYPDVVSDATRAGAEIPTELARLRSSIDNIDAALVHLLAERFKCTQQVGELKAERSLPAADPAREEQQVARLRALADEAGLDPVFAEKFLSFITAEVIHHHERIAAGEE